jgi:hypothetical protein
VPVALLRNGADRTDETAAWQNGKKAKPNQRGRFESAGDEVGISGLDRIVEAGDFLPNLGANAAHEQVSKRGHLAEDDDWPVLDLAIGLRKRRQGYIARPH